jgi:hypothetical protein
LETGDEADGTIAMSTPEPTSGVPVWARKRRKPSNPLVGWVLAPLALFGALTAGLAVREKSMTGAGAQMDGWIVMAHDRVQQVLHPRPLKPNKPMPSAKAAVSPVKPVDATAVVTPAPTTAATPGVGISAGHGGSGL